MDCSELLKLLTKFEEDSETAAIADDKLYEILERVYSCLTEDDLKKIVEERNAIHSSNDTGWIYLHMLLFTVKTFCVTELNQENPLFTVEQFKLIKTSIEIATTVGIIPSLPLHIQTHLTRNQSRRFKLKMHDNSIIDKYKIVSYTLNVFLECFKNDILRPALISQLNCQLAALLQLAHAPLKKPNCQTSNNAGSDTDFEMTFDLYSQLKQEQDMFLNKLLMLMDDCPQYLVIKELMIIMSLKNNPKWLISKIKYYLTDRIMRNNGVISLTIAICDEVTDLGKCWDKLDVTARIVASSHGQDAEKYYDAICPQVLKMLNSTENNQEILIAKCIIKALYDFNHDVCKDKIINNLMAPFLVKINELQNKSIVVKSEKEVSQCIENLCKLFITTHAEFTCLPTNVLAQIALPLFYLYSKSKGSIYPYQNQIKQLISKVLEEEDTRENIFSAFLNKTCKFKELGERLNYRFSANGGLEVISEPPEIDLDLIATCIISLVENEAKLSFSLFTYLLKILPEISSAAVEAEKGILLETTMDTLDRIAIPVTALKMLTLLADLKDVQTTLMQNPEPVLTLIKFFFSKITAHSSKKDEESHLQNIEILYASLMLVKHIVTTKQKDVSITWKTFEDFIRFIKEQTFTQNIPGNIISIVEEIDTVIKKKGKSTKNYYDASANKAKLSDFQKALADLTDPLIPVRAHGIIELTKLIENRHPETDEYKNYLFCIFQENLAHEDSFVYLAAVNGMCALSSTFPEKVIEVLVQEFIGLTSRTKHHDIKPENRAKLGEILVRTTKALGEMTPKYKDVLVNGFLCGTRDPDPLVRASSLSCLGEFCKIMGFRVGNLMTEILFCIGCIVKTDKDDSCRRAGVLVATLLLRGLGKDALTELGTDLVPLYRSLKHLRDNDRDPVLQLHAQLALEEFSNIVQQYLSLPPKLGIFEMCR